MRKAVLGIDPGSKRIGVAVCDDETGIAMPLALIAADKHDHVEELAKLARERNVSEVVVGLPKQMNGTEGLQAESARALAEALRRMLEVPVILFDERLTTVSAEAALRSSGKKSRRQRPIVDKAAAVVLLQAYIDREDRR